MMKSDKIWQELERIEKPSSGLIYRRYSGNIKSNIYVALKVPEKLRCIATHINISTDFNVDVWNKFQDIRIEKLKDEYNSNKQFLLILLLNNQHKDIFSTLCEDLIKNTANITEEQILIKELISRLEKWHLLFEKLSRKGLSQESQRGLYGELHFLRKFLNNCKDAQFCVDTWKGPEKAVQDFQYSNWAVEIKTSHGKNQQKIYISSERQLDISYVPEIYLLQLSLDVRQSSGESLNQIVDRIIDLLNDYPAAYSAFRFKLMLAGYFDHHREYYEYSTYHIRFENYYRVNKNFPKITEEMIPSGVGDVRYSIIITGNDNWKIQEDQLFNQILTS